VDASKEPPQIVCVPAFHDRLMTCTMTSDETPMVLQFVRCAEKGVDHDKPKARAWLGKMFQKSISGALILGKDVTVELLAALVKQYLVARSQDLLN
jgi:hypothetical protein